MESSVKRVAIYARVSTHDQNCAMQLDDLREYAARRGFEVVSEYVDAGISGSKDSRPQLNRLMADAFTRRFSAVIVWRLDRFSRSLKHLVCAIEELQGCGVDFISLRDSFDLSSPAGRMMLALLGAFAQMEREIIRERCIAGQQAARRRGVKIGRPKVWISADKIKALREAGTPWRAVAKKMGAGVGTCMRALQKESAA